MWRGRGSRELFTLAVLVLALGIAVGSAELFGASMALGAFLAGLVIGQSEFSSRAADEALADAGRFRRAVLRLDGDAPRPRTGLGERRAHRRDARPHRRRETPGHRSSWLSFWDRASRLPLSVGVALAQIGEFSFILAGLGRQLGILPERATQTLVAASIVSITLNPLLYRLVPVAVRRFSGRSPGPERDLAAATPRSGRSRP